MLIYPNRPTTRKVCAKRKDFEVQLLVTILVGAYKGGKFQKDPNLTFEMKAGDLRCKDASI